MIAARPNTSPLRPKRPATRLSFPRRQLDPAERRRAIARLHRRTARRPGRRAASDAQRTSTQRLAGASRRRRLPGRGCDFRGAAGWTGWSASATSGQKPVRRPHRPGELVACQRPPTSATRRGRRDADSVGFMNGGSASMLDHSAGPQTARLSRSDPKILHPEVRQ